MNPTTVRHLYLRLLLLAVWFAVTAIATATLAHSNVDLHSAYPAAGRGFLSP